MTEGTEYDLPTLPEMPAPGWKDENMLAKSQNAQARTQPAGILKKTSQPARDETTGKFSVKSGFTLETTTQNPEFGTSHVVRHHRTYSNADVMNDAGRPVSALVVATQRALISKGRRQLLSTT